MSTVCTAKASYKKLPGLLELTSTHLQWTQDGKKAPAVRVAHSEVSCAFDVNSFQAFWATYLHPHPSFQHSFPRRKARLKYASKLASRMIATATTLPSLRLLPWP